MVGITAAVAASPPRGNVVYSKNEFSAKTSAAECGRWLWWEHQGPVPAGPCPQPSGGLRQEASPEPRHHSAIPKLVWEGTRAPTALCSVLGGTRRQRLRGAYQFSGVRCWVITACLPAEQLFLRTSKSYFHSLK